MTSMIIKMSSDIDVNGYSYMSADTIDIID